MAKRIQPTIFRIHPNVLIVKGSNKFIKYVMEEAGAIYEDNLYTKGKKN